MPALEERLTQLRSRVNQFAMRRAALDRRLNRISNLRVASFLLAIAAFTAAALLPAFQFAFVVLVLALVAAFLGLVVLFQRVRRAAAFVEELRRLNAEAVSKVLRRWHDVPLDAAHAPEEHPYATDLNLFGRVSLFQLIWCGGTPWCRDKLKSWLLTPSPEGAALTRQRAVRELSDAVDLRDRLLATARGIDPAGHSADRLVAWTREPPGLLHAKPIVAAIWVTPLATLSLTASDLGLPGPQPYWIIPLVGSILIWWFTREAARRVLHGAAAVDEAARVLRRTISRLTDASFSDPHLTGLRARLLEGPIHPTRQLTRLSRILQSGELRNSSLLHAVMNAATLWDAHVVVLLDRWKRDVGPHVATWLDSAGELEALACLGALAFQHPTWTWPTFDDRLDASLTARRLGHPLLEPTSGITNDVTVGPGKRILVVSGSNMSGKSTFLRAIGLNVVLAYAGAPVCASSFRLPAVKLHTYMHVHDSFEHGHSQFMAELLRLRQLVRESVYELADGRRLLYLIDEPLRGTHPREQRIAVQGFLEYLSARPAFGVVATHQPEIIQESQLSHAAEHVHFSSTLERRHGEPSLSFDYRLKTGPADSSNALELMRQIGLLGGPSGPCADAP